MEDNCELVTVILIAFNQEKWIKDAINGILTQTYQQIELIISDDNSSDKTFAIMQREVSAYKGHKKIILSRNNANLGIAGHLDKVVRMASGGLIIYACGDDISLPQRVSKIVDVWNKYDKASILIHSNFQSIDKNGIFLEDDFLINDDRYRDIKHLCKTNMFVVGATCAYTKNIITDFPKILPELVHEDCCTPFRALLIGAPIASIKDRLVLYRRTGITSNYTTKNSRDQARLYFKRTAIDYRQKIIDLEFRGRSDLLPIVKKQHSACIFSERCADPSISLTKLLSCYIEYRPPIIIAIMRLFKYRIGFGIRP